MRTLLLALSVALMGLSLGGCALPTPGYTGGFASIRFPEERYTGEVANRIIRGMDYDLKQANEDLISVLLLEPASHMTKWNVR